MRYYRQQRWHSAPCPEGFSLGTPVSLTTEKTNISKFQLNKIGDTLRWANWDEKFFDYSR